jgi:tetratricopeptide (TPR) repeat protein
VALYAAPGRLGEWLGPAERDAEALGDPTLLAYVHLAQASALFIQGRMAEALPLLEQIRPTAEASADPLLRAQYPAVLGQVLALRGEYPRSIEALNAAIALLQEQPQSQIEVTVATEMLGAVYAYMGQFERALEILGAMHAQTESIQDQAALAASHGFLCSVYQMRGDWAQARRFGELAVETARSAGNVVHEYVGLVFLGLPEARLGDPDRGAETLRRAIAMAEGAGTWVLLGRAHGWLAEVEVLRERPDEALRLAETGLELGHRHGYLFDAALCERARGEALRALGETPAAQAALEAAVAQFEAIGAGPELERSRAALAGLNVGAV